MLYELLSGEVDAWEIAPRFSDLLANTSVRFFQDTVKLLHPSYVVPTNGSERPASSFLYLSPRNTVQQSDSLIQFRHVHALAVLHEQDYVLLDYGAESKS
ncbi:hypothetical protein Ancab_034472 [Ancistrocladus abbreviatus]